MDIDEYLNRKKELEKKKEVLETEEKLNKKRSKQIKKDIEVKRRREITYAEEPDNHSNHHRHSSYHTNPPRKSEGFQWIFLGLAFFVALLIIGIYFITQYMNSSISEEDEELTEVEKLQQQIEELKESMNDTKEEIINTTQEKINETNNDSEELGTGPEIEFYIIDDWDDSESLGIFNEKGKISGNTIELWGDGTISYEYRLVIENKERSNIFCSVDELVEVDEDQDNEIDESDYDPILYMLKLKSTEEEIMKRTLVNKEGIVRAEYEATCSFCGNAACDENKVLLGETKKITKLKVILHTTSFNNNNTNNS
jgi:hypothetical protein